MTTPEQKVRTTPDRYYGQFEQVDGRIVNGLLDTIEQLQQENERLKAALAKQSRAEILNELKDSLP